MYLFGPKDFLGVAEAGKVAPLIFERETGRETPISAYLKLGAGPDSFLLESAGESPSLTEYSFVGSRPFKVVRTHGRNPLPLLRSAVGALAPGGVEVELPFWGGAVGYLSYDVARYLERLPTLTWDDLALPEAVFIFPEVLLVFDHRANRLFVCVNQVVGTRKHKALSDTERKLEATLTALDGQGSLLPPPSSRLPGVVTPNLTRAQYEAIVRRAKEYIFAGDIFQANLSVRFQLPYGGDPLDTYRALMAVNPSPFAAYLDFGSFQLVSSSPERLIRLRAGRADTRPIAGTRRRGDDEAEDEDLSADLILDEKERAEHIMLVDLERNDLGRVCAYGTVLPSELFTIEKYSHVIHIVSNVRGRLALGKDQFDLARAMFPGGTITGCPKVRCMEIIEELEPTRRGPYTGGIGYFGFNGNMDMNIVIRTFVLKDGRAYVQAGSGIVADSDPAREYFEAVSKAGALLKAAGVEEEAVKWERLPM